MKIAMLIVHGIPPATGTAAARVIICVIYAQMVSVETDFARRNVLGILLAMVMADVEWNCRG